MIRFYIVSFLSIKLLNELSYPFHLTYYLSTFFLITFSIPNSSWFISLQFFFIKCSKNFFTIKITNNKCPQSSVFNFFNYKIFFKPIGIISFSKNAFIFLLSNMITNFEFRIFITNFFTKINICIILTSTCFILIVLCYVLLHSFTIWFSLINPFFICFFFQII